MEAPDLLPFPALGTHRFLDTKVFSWEGAGPAQRGPGTVLHTSCPRGSSPAEPAHHRHGVLPGAGERWMGPLCRQPRPLGRRGPTCLLQGRSLWLYWFLAGPTLQVRGNPSPHPGPVMQEAKTSRSSAEAPRLEAHPTRTGVDPSMSVQVEAHRWGCHPWNLSVTEAAVTWGPATSPASPHSVLGTTPHRGVILIL